MDPATEIGKCSKPHDLDRIAKEVVTAGDLKPNRLAAARTALDLRVPIEEPRAKVLVGGLRLAGRIDQATEQSLLAAT